MFFASLLQSMSARNYENGLTVCLVLSADFESMYSLNINKFKKNFTVETSE